jgi:hypothetical protein
VPRSSHPFFCHPAASNRQGNKFKKSKGGQKEDRASEDLPRTAPPHLMT